MLSSVIQYLSIFDTFSFLSRAKIAKYLLAPLKQMQYQTIRK